MDKKPKGGTPPPGGQPMALPGMPPGLPGMPPMPNAGGKPMVVVVMKGGGNPNLPFMMGGGPPGGKKKKTKKSKGGKRKKKSGKKKPNGEDESDSDSDRMSAPELPTAHTLKPPGGAPGTPNKGGVGGIKPGTPMGAGLGGPSTTSTSTTSTTSGAGAAPGGAGAAGGKTPVKKTPVKKAPVKPGAKKEHFIIKDGNVDKSCVPMFTLMDGPGGCPIVVPIDARDECAIVPELGPQPLNVAPKETTRGYLVLNEDGLLHFKPQKECPNAPFASTPGQLQKFLANSNIFIADGGPLLPDPRAHDKVKCTATKDKIGAEVAVSGHVTISEKGGCKFTRVAVTQSFPFYPPNAAMGVLVKDLTNSHVFWVPTENRFVGPVLSQGIRPTIKPVTEAAIVGNIYKDAAGAAVWEAPSDKKDNLMGYIMSSATGVPIYVSKPDDNLVRPATPSKLKKAGAVTPTATSVTGQTASPSPASAAGSTTNAAAAATNDGTAGQPGTTSATAPPSDPAAAAEGEKKEEVQDAFKKMIASQGELPPVPPVPASAEQPQEEAQEEHKQEEQQEDAPPLPPKPDKNDEYRKYKEERSNYL